MTMQKKSALPHLAAHLESLFGRKNWLLLWQTYTLDRNWNGIAGCDVARQCRPAYIRKNILWITVRSSAWMHHLQSMKPALLEKVRLALPETVIDDLRWIMEPAENPPVAAQAYRRAERVPDPDQTRAFERMAAGIENSDCRAALCRLWRTYQKFR